jgi:hypothetical protein
VEQKKKSNISIIFFSKYGLDNLGNHKLMGLLQSSEKSSVAARDSWTKESYVTCKYNRRQYWYSIVTVRIGSINFKIISTKYFKYRLFATEMLVSCKLYCCLSAPHSSSEICQPFFEKTGTRPVRTQHKDNNFHGKRNIAKFTRSTIWGVQLKSGDN